MKSTLVFFVCIICIVASQQPSDDHPVVNAPTGKIRGSTMTSRLGKKIYSFRAIRYGEPPTGHQRFQPPIKVKDWKDVFDATEEGPSCPYPTARQMSEDCLRLNVYTTKLPCESENVSRPVLVFVHPGGFYSFSGQSSIFGPQYLMDKDIVLVTINYRVGSLGFLSTGDSLAPGNNGMKDQVMALRWVQRNIAAFGGNPNSVTLGGYSAGSFSAMLHMVSPMSKNLFHRAIGMSSSAMGSSYYSSIAQNGQKELAKKQAELLGCPTDSTGSMLLCLTTKPIENFTDTMNSMFEWKGNPILLWKPTVEPEVRGVERFLDQQPYDSIKQGKFQQVPFILGVTKDEFGGVTTYYERDEVFGNGSLYRELNDNWDTLAPIIFMYERDTPRSRYITKELRKFYFGDQPISYATNQQLSQIYADSVILFPVFRAAKLFAAKSSAPVYFYKFTYQGRKSFYMFNDTTPSGVSHHDDMQYIFYMEQLFPYIDTQAPEAPMVDIYTSIFGNFVKTGEPIPKDNEKLRNVRWSKLVPEQTNFLEINLHPSMKNEFFPERMRTWERLFPEPSSPSHGAHHNHHHHHH